MTCIHNNLAQLFIDTEQHLKFVLFFFQTQFFNAKEDLFQAIETEIGPKREAYLSIRGDEEQLDAILHAGANRARKIAQSTIQRVRSAVGID